MWIWFFVCAYLCCVLCAWLVTSATWRTVYMCINTSFLYHDAHPHPRPCTSLLFQPPFLLCTCLSLCHCPIASAECVCVCLAFTLKYDIFNSWKLFSTVCRWVGHFTAWYWGKHVCGCGYTALKLNGSYFVMWLVNFWEDPWRGLATPTCARKIMLTTRRLLWQPSAVRGMGIMFRPT